MSRTKILQLFYSNLILLPIILCKVPPTNILYGIDRRNLDNEYCRLLFDASLDNCARLDIAARLSALLVYESIETDLAIIDLRIGQIFERNKFLAARNLNKSTIRAKFDELNTKIWKKKTGEKRFGMEDVCRLWSFGLEVTKLNEFLNKNQTIGEKEMNKLATLLKLNKNSECKQLAKVENVFEAKYGELALWVFDFINFISKKHFLILKELLAEAENAQLLNFSVWTNFCERINGESEFSHTLRMLNGKGEIDQIVRTKQMMNRYLMEYKYIGMLELHNPLTMAFDIICDSILKTAFRGIIMFDGTLSNEMALQNKKWLQISLLCGKIIDYFMQQIQNAKTEGANNEAKIAKIGNHWKLFARLLGLFKDNSEFNDQNLLLNKLDTLFDYLRGQFGEQKLSFKYKRMVQRLELCFLELYEQNAEFRECLGINNLSSMALLKELFEIAEANEQIISEQLWAVLVTNLSGEGGIIVPLKEKVADQMPISTILECPDKNIPLKKLEQFDDEEAKKDDEAFSLMFLYKEVIINAGDNVDFHLHLIEMHAIIFNLKISIRTLFNFSKKLVEKSDKFEKKINQFENEWKKREDVEKIEEKLCEMHKFAYLMCKNGVLSEENFEWREFIRTQMAREASDNFYERELILLPEEDEFRWSESDCADEIVQNKLISAFFKDRMAPIQFHFVAWDAVLRRFGQIRHFFCYGTDQIEVAIVKENFRHIFGELLLDRLELAHPKIMHFESTAYSHFLLLLLQQLNNKTDSVPAELAEARKNAPILLLDLQFYEQNLEGDLAESKAISDAIQSVQEHFYRYLIEMQKSKKHSIRNAFCVLSSSIGLLKSEMALNLKWHLIYAKCEKEANVKEAIAAQRNRMRGLILNFLSKTLANKIFILPERIKGIRGGRTRILKMLYDPDISFEQNEEKLADLWDAMQPDLSTIDYGDSELLISHYEEALLNTDDLIRIEGKMKADICVFLNWINSQFLSNNLFSSAIRNNASKYCYLSLQMVDDFYDQIFDEQSAEVEQNEHDLVDLIFEIKTQLEKILAGHSMKSSELGLLKAWPKWHVNRLMHKKAGKSFVKAKHWDDYGLWMRQLHGQMFVQLLKVDENFAQKLKNEFETSLMKKYYLIELLEIESSKEVLNMLGINASKIFEPMETFRNLVDKEMPEKKKITKNKSKKRKNIKNNKEKTEEKEKNLDDKNNELFGYFGGKIIAENEKVEENICKSSENAKISVEQNIEEKSNNLENTKQLENVGFENISNATKKTEEEKEFVVTNNSPEKLDLNEFVGIKLADFANDHFLALKYGEFVAVNIRAEEAAHSAERRHSKMPAFPALQQFGEENCEKCKKNWVVVTHSLLKLLDIGILANEIWHSVQAIKALNESKCDERWANIELELAQLKEINLNEEINAKSLEGILFRLLKRIVRLTEKEFVVENAQNSNSEIEFCQQIRHQLHLRKFSMALFHSDKFWSNLSEIRRKKIVSKLFRVEDEKTIELFVGKVEKYLILIKKLNDQWNLDESLFYEYKNGRNKFVSEKAKKKLHSDKSTLPHEFAKNWQEINFVENSNRKSKQIIQIKNYLMANGYFSESEMHKNERIVSELTRIVEEWCPNAIVQFPLSLLENEKLEPICILPEEIDRELIFGKLNFEMSEMAAKCEDKSLYCNLLMRSEFKSVRKIVKELTALPTLQFNFTDVPIEMAFILVPKVKLANFDVPIGLKTYEKLAKYFAENIEHFLNADHFDEGMHIDEVKLQNMIRKQLEKSKSFNGKFELDKVLGELKQLTNTKEAALKQRQIVAEQKVMLLALSRNFINEKIFEILSPDTKLEENICGMVKQNYNNKNERLRVALAYLELWAKNNFIHGRNMGYLDTPMLLIMMAKVFLMFPEASIPFLIEKYFLFYSKWKWPMPVQLSQIDDKRIGEFLSWAPGREWFTKRQFLPKNLRKTIGQALAMPIISPLFPEQNEAAQINLSTAKVIQNELKYAFIKIRNLTDKSHDIIKSIAGNCKRFSEKYEHFVTFTCGGTKFNVEKFCDFVGKRLRHELLYFVENSLANWVRFCHVHPTRVPVEQSSNEQQQQQQQQQQQIGGSNNNLHKNLWLVGLKLHTQKIQNKFVDELIEKLAEISAKIKKDFEGDLFYNVQLHYEYVERSKLAKWIRF